MTGGRSRRAPTGGRGRKTEDESVPAVLADVPVVLPRSHDEPHLRALRAPDQPAPQHRSPPLDAPPSGPLGRSDRLPEFLRPHVSATPFKSVPECLLSARF